VFSSVCLWVCLFVGVSVCGCLFVGVSVCGCVCLFGVNTITLEPFEITFAVL